MKINKAIVLVSLIVLSSNVYAGGNGKKKPPQSDAKAPVETVWNWFK